MLKSPFVFGDFQTRTLPGTDSRHVSYMIQESIDAVYQAGRRDGSRFGSIGGSRLGSVHASFSPSPTTSKLVRDQQGIIEPSFQWDETDVGFPPLQRDSEDSRSNDFVVEDLTTNADYQPETLTPICHQPVQPNVQAQAPVLADVRDHDTSDAGFLEPAGQKATSPVQTIEDKIQTFHIPDDEPTVPFQTAPPAHNPDKRVAKKAYDAQKSSVTKMINEF